MYQYPIIASRPQKTQVSASIVTNSDTSNASNPRRRLTIQHNNAEWEAIKKEITAMFMNQDLKRLEIENHFQKKDPPFIATKRQWDLRLEQWRLRINIPKKKKAAMNKLKDKRLEDHGKKTEFRYMGRAVPIHKLDRDKKGSQSEGMIAVSVPTPSTISNVTAFTPKDMRTPRDFDSPGRPQTPYSLTVGPNIMSEMGSETSRPRLYCRSPSSWAAPSPTFSDISIATDYTFQGQSPAPIRPETPISLDENAFNNIDEDTDLILMPLPSHIGSKTQARYLQDEEEELLAELQDAEQTFGKDQKETWDIMEKLFEILWKQGRYKSAEVLASRVLKARKMLPCDYPGALRAAIRLGTIQIIQGRYAEGGRRIRTAVKTLQTIVDDEEILYSGYRYLNAISRDDNERTFFAEKLVLSSAKLFGVGGNEHCKSRGQRAESLLSQGKVDAATIELRDIVGKLGHIQGKDGNHTIMHSSNLAECLRRNRSLEEAFTVISENKAVAHRVLGFEHPLSLYCMFVEAHIYIDKGNMIQGETLLRMVLKGEEKVFGRNHWRPKITRKDLEYFEARKHANFNATRP